MIEAVNASPLVSVAYSSRYHTLLSDRISETQVLVRTINIDTCVHGTI